MSSLIQISYLMLWYSRQSNCSTVALNSGSGLNKNLKDKTVELLVAIIKNKTKKKQVLPIYISIQENKIKQLVLSKTSWIVREKTVIQTS